LKYIPNCNVPGSEYYGTVWIENNTLISTDKRVNTPEQGL